MTIKETLEADVAAVKARIEAAIPGAQAELVAAEGKLKEFVANVPTEFHSLSAEVVAWVKSHL